MTLDVHRTKNSVGAHRLIELQLARPTEVNGDRCILGSLALNADAKDQLLPNVHPNCFIDPFDSR